MSAYNHGPTARENRVLALWEKNMDAEAIADELGMSKRYVQQVISNLAVPAMTNWQGPAAAASDKLLAALRRHHPERCA